MNPAQVHDVFPRADSRWLNEIFRVAPAYGIDTPNEMASFLAQFGHETRGFTRFEESLNYSAERLMAVWPRRFPDIVIANQYAHNPEALANKVYGGRKDLGNTEPGDGWNYRGRGPQLTGRHNYGWASGVTGLDLLKNPDLVLSPRWGVMIACKGWKVLKLDAVDDDADVREETHAVNGGAIGLAERQNLYDQLIVVLE